MRRLAWLCVVVLLIGSIGCVSDAVRLERKQARIAAEREEAAAVRAAAVAAMKITVLDSFDSALSWRLDATESDPAKVTRVTPKAGSKDQAMAAAFALGPKKKIVLGRRTARPADLSKQAAVVIDVDNKTGGDCGLSLALLTLPGWKYAESPVVTVCPGVSDHVMFRLDAATFKTEASKWQYSQRVQNLSAVGKMVLILHPAAGGSVEVDNVRLAAAAPKAK